MQNSGKCIAFMRTGEVHYNQLGLNGLSHTFSYRESFSLVGSVILMEDGQVLYCDRITHGEYLTSRWMRLPVIGITLGSLWSLCSIGAIREVKMHLENLSYDCVQMKAIIDLSVKRMDYLTCRRKMKLRMQKRNWVGWLKCTFGKAEATDLIECEEYSSMSGNARIRSEAREILNNTKLNTNVQLYSALESCFKKRLGSMDLEVVYTENT